MPRLCALLVFGVLCSWVSVTSASGDDPTSFKCPSSCRCEPHIDYHYVDCQDENLTAIPKDLPSTTDSVVLSLNPLRKLPAEAFSSVGAVNLIQITLNDCQIEDLNKDAFSGLNKLDLLSIAYNRIRTIPVEAFRGTPSLKELYMDDNPIEKLEDGIFSNLTKLRSVSLTSCHISSIGFRVFESVPSLNYLALDRNQLSTMEVSTFKPLLGVQEVLLDGNPWKCDCHLLEFRNFIMERPQYEDPKCASPDRLKGKFWRVLDEKDFICEP